MKRFITAAAVIGGLIASNGISYANSAGGQVLCTDNTPLGGVRLVLTPGNCSTLFPPGGVSTTDANGNYIYYLGDCPGPFTLCIDTTSLPPGATINGSPCVAVTGDTSLTINWSINCHPLPPPSPNCVTIAAMQGVPITPVTLTGSGGCGGPYTFTESGLPSGLTMSSGGTISGTPTVTGTFSYTVTVTDKCGNTGSISCSVTVAPPPSSPLAPGDTATIGFWHNKNGQALIDSFNGGPTSTALGNWLAANYGCLFGNLNGEPNTVVAAQFMTYFNVTGTKTYAQILAGALADYATNPTLAGGTEATQYGFDVSGSGTGSKTYNVGLDGTAIGLSNNTSYTVAQLLAAANAKCSGGVISPGAFIALNDIFSGINQSGDIQ